MAQIRRRCLTLNDHTLINFSPSTIFPLRSVFSSPPPRQKYIYVLYISGVQDDSDSYTSPYIFHPTTSFSLFLFLFFFSFMSARAFKWPLHKIA
jgi:hypothetical protein